jgi:ATP-dependent Clp protease adaptor protein ClpS
VSAPKDPNNPDGGRPGDQVVIERAPKIQKPKMWKVVLHNDDYTTMEFVIEVLVAYFGKSRDEAMHLMLYVHTRGRAVAGVYTREVAETKVELATEYARKNGHPLLVTMEPE